MLHKHHIIPKHMGGSDDPSNIAMLSVEEHAEAHMKLYEQYGREEDRIAWHGLAGIIGHEEAVSQMCRMAQKKSAAVTPRGKDHYMYGKVIPGRDPKKASAAGAAATRGKKQSPELIAKRTAAVRAYWEKKRANQKS